jgi:predicted membrane-bound dolichyl-phosphate-mannose-protein mannosyltransferase
LLPLPIPSGGGSPTGCFWLLPGPLGLLPGVSGVASAGRGAGLAALVFVAAYVAAAWLVWANGASKALGIRDYISDEIWYVSSAVNVARDVLGLHIVPRTGNGTVVYTVFYDNSTCSLQEAEALARGEVPGLRVLNRSYEKATAFAVEAPLGEYRRLEALRGAGGGCITDVMPGVAPDEEGINTYLNTEHPPLVKYVLALVIYLGGWHPAAWRLASLAVGLLGLAAAVHTGYLAYRSQDRRSLLTAVLAAAVFPAAAWRDPSLSSMSTVAMLDIYAASLDAVSLALLASGRPRASALALGLAGSAKYTGLFPSLAHAALVYAETRDTRKTLLVSVIAPLVVVAALWLPFAAAKGPGWVVEQVAGAVAWHTTSRPPGPPSTTPIGLILGRNGFPLYYTPDGRPLLVAVCNPGVCATGVAAGAAMLAAAAAAACTGRWRTKHRVMAASGGYPFAAWLGYAAVYAAGNHTLYSFYSVQISMLSLAALASIPLLVEEAGLLHPRVAAGCARTHPEHLAAASAAAGVAVSAAAAGGWPVLAPRPLLDPLAAALDPSSKLARIGVAASTLLLYTVAAARATRRRESPLAAAYRWLMAGLLSYTGPLAPLAPVLLVATLRPGLLEGLLAGLAGPGPAGLVAGAHLPPRRRAVAAVGYTLGYLAALWLLSGSTLSPPIATVGDVAVFALATSLVAVLYSAPASRGLSYAASAALDPSLAPLLPAAGRGGAAAAPVAAVALATRSTLPVLVAALAASAAEAAGLLGSQQPKRPGGGVVQPAA